MVSDMHFGNRGPSPLSILRLRLASDPIQIAEVIPAASDPTDRECLQPSYTASELAHIASVVSLKDLVGPSKNLLTTCDLNGT